MEGKERGKSGRRKGRDGEREGYLGALGVAKRSANDQLDVIPSKIINKCERKRNKIIKRR